MQNESEMKYDAFLCFRFVFLIFKKQKSWSGISPDLSLRSDIHLRSQIHSTISFGSHWKDYIGKLKIEVTIFLCSPLDFRWIREVFMSSTIGFKRMGRKLDFEKDDKFTFHLLERDSQVGNVTSHNVIHAIEKSKRVVFILSTCVII